MRINSKKRKRFLKNIKTKINLYKKKRISYKKVESTFISYREHILKGNNNSFKLRIDILELNL